MSTGQRPFTGLGLTNPVLAAPMAGGPSTPALVSAAAEAGSLGFLAGGYRSPDELVGQVKSARAQCDRFGVNLFAPNPVPVDPEEFHRYARAIQPEGDLYGLDLASSPPFEDDDSWQAKVDILVEDPVPVVSFTFGIPDRATITALRRAGTVVLQTVTSVNEARQATDANVDALVVQGFQAGAHSGTLTPESLPEHLPLTDLVEGVRHSVKLPIVAAGGLATMAEVAAVLGAGANAVMVGTVLLRCHESGASATYKKALAERRGTETIVTRSFTGRPARALRNLWTDRYHDLAPSGYPAVHHLTAPVRRAAAAAGDAERISLWAGVGVRQATDEPAAGVLGRLASQT
jgi:nitronate monooxygenase